MAHQRWRFATDMNHDGQFTISDIWPLAEYVLFLPGDYFIDEAKDQKFGKFLELSTNSYGGVLSGLVSLMAWALAITIVSAILGALADLADPNRSD